MKDYYNEYDRCLVVAEIGQAHDGSIGMCHAFIDAISDAGANVVKFQIHLANKESTYDEKFRVRMYGNDRTRYDYWKRMEFSKDQWSELIDHAREKEIGFLASPFSLEALEMLAELDCGAVKIASGEVSNHHFLAEVGRLNWPVFLSTGMSSWKEIDTALDILSKRNSEITVMQCTSKYPTRMTEVGINVVEDFQQKFDTKVGISDHSGTVFPSLMAISMALDALEVHVVFDKRMYGPDVNSSVTIDDLALLSSYRDACYEMRTSVVDKDRMAADLSEMKQLFGRSIALKKALSSGTILKKEDLSLKKPGSGIRPEEISKVVGRRLTNDLVPESLLRWEDFE